MQSCLKTVNNMSPGHRFAPIRVARKTQGLSKQSKRFHAICADFNLAQEAIFIRAIQSNEMKRTISREISFNCTAPGPTEHHNAHVALHAWLDFQSPKDKTSIKHFVARPVKIEEHHMPSVSAVIFFFISLLLLSSDCSLAKWLFFSSIPEVVAEMTHRLFSSLSLSRCLCGLTFIGNIE